MYLPVLVIDTIVVEVIGPREDSIVGQVKGFASSNFMELSTITILNINYMSLMILYYSTWYSTGVKWSHCIVIY